MNFKIVEKDEAIIVGKEIRISNKDENCNVEIEKLWKEFLEQKLEAVIQGKIKSGEILGLYTDYENKEFGTYSFIVGCEVSDLAVIPKGMVLKVIPSSKYCVITARGKMPDSICKVWEYVWKGDIERTYTGDFELYDKRYDGSENSEVDIYVAVK